MCVRNGLADLWVALAKTHSKGMAARATGSKSCLDGCDEANGLGNM